MNRPMHNTCGRKPLAAKAPARVVHPPQREDRRALLARVPDDTYRSISERAAEETGGNVSEMTRRMLKWALSEQGIEVEL